MVNSPLSINYVFVLIGPGQQHHVYSEESVTVFVCLAGQLIKDLPLTPAACY